MLVLIISVHASVVKLCRVGIDPSERGKAAKKWPHSVSGVRSSTLSRGWSIGINISAPKGQGERALQATCHFRNVSEVVLCLRS